MAVFPGGGLSPALAALRRPVAAPAPRQAPVPEPANDRAEQLVKQAQSLIQQAIQAEPEPDDRLELHQIATSMAKYIAGEQQLKDQAMGAGAGAKMVRKATAGRSTGY